MKRYAEGTTVTVESSRAEISSILTKHGVIRQAWASEPEGDTLQFEMKGNVYRLRMARPTLADIHKMYPNAYNDVAKQSAEWRRRWRANVLLLKAKLEFADGDATSIERELLPYTVLKDGRTIEEALLDGGLNLLPAKTGS